jgi:hypothetical protein
MKRYVIIKEGVVLNAVEYKEQPVGTPPSFEEGVIAIEDNTASVGWLYVNKIFTNPNPPVTVVLK